MTIDLETAPKITLGGQDFSIPLLVARQNMVIDPIIIRLLPVLAAVQADKISGLSVITADVYKDMFEVAYTAISRGYPNLKRENLLDMPITTLELLYCLPVIARQTGIFKFTANTSADASSGEAVAGNSQTGNA